MEPTDEQRSAPKGRLVYPHTTVLETRKALSSLALKQIDRAFDALPPIFRECCDDEYPKLDLGYPFVSKGYVYATDGRIGVRTTTGVPAVEKITRARWRGRVPTTIGELFEGPFVDRPATVPSVANYAPCRVCDGRRKVYFVQCEECEDGCIPIEDGAGVRCDSCGGMGRFWTKTRQTCYACLGCGRDKPHTSIAVEDFLIALHYLERIVRHGGTLYRSQSNSHEDPHRFVLPGGTEGIIMGMKPAEP